MDTSLGRFLRLKTDARHDLTKKLTTSDPQQKVQAGPGVQRCTGQSAFYDYDADI
jgi:hypothetical protein